MGLMVSRETEAIDDGEEARTEVENRKEERLQDAERFDDFVRRNLGEL